MKPLHLTTSDPHGPYAVAKLALEIFSQAVVCTAVGGAIGFLAWLWVMA